MNNTSDSIISGQSPGDDKLAVIGMPFNTAKKLHDSDGEEVFRK